MLYSELRNLTNGQCTPEEYARRHREQRSAEVAEKRSLEYISTLSPGDRVMIPGVGLLCITADAYEDYNRHMRRNILFYPGTSIICPQPVYLGWITSGDWHIVNGNPARLTKGGRVIA